jgi:hypothetical protein
LASLGGEKPQRERLAEWWGWYGSDSSSKMEKDRLNDVSGSKILFSCGSMSSDVRARIRVLERDYAIRKGREEAITVCELVVSQRGIRIHRLVRKIVVYYLGLN